MRKRKQMYWLPERYLEHIQHFNSNYQYLAFCK